MGRWTEELADGSVGKVNNGQVENGGDGGERVGDC